MRSTFLCVFAGLMITVLAHAQGPPSLCKPCLFYGGDYNPTDPNSIAFADENTLVYPNYDIYGAILLPGDHTVSVEGILFQIQFLEQNTILDPDGVTWEIRKGVRDGSGGTVIASGQGPVSKEATGRTGSGFEYTVRVKLDPPVQLSGGGGRGTIYWFNLTPQCTKRYNPACESNQYEVSNTTDQTNNFRGVAQAAGQIFFDNTQTNWENVCQFGFNGSQCGYLSFGLTGTVIQ
jgi:hypothetical protein